MRKNMLAAAALSAGVLISSALPLSASALTVPPVLAKPFGGRITAITPCLGVGFVVATILQPPAMKPIQVAAYPSPFLYNMMSHPGQFTLGLLGAPVFCLQDWDGDGFDADGSFFYGTSI